MAPSNAFGPIGSCTSTFSTQMNNFFSHWYATLLPLVALVLIYFIMKKYVKDKRILNLYIIIAVLIYAWWIPNTFLHCV